MCTSKGFTCCPVVPGSLMTAVAGGVLPEELWDCSSKVHSRTSWVPGWPSRAAVKPTQPCVVPAGSAAARSIGTVSAGETRSST